MVIRLALNIKAARVFKDIFIAVSRGIKQSQNIVLLYLLPVQLSIGVGNPRKLDYRRSPAQDFLDGWLDDCGRIPLKHPHLIRVIDKCTESAGDSVAGSFVAGDYQKGKIRK